MKKLIIKPIKDIKIGQVYLNKDTKFIVIDGFTGERHTAGYEDNEILEVEFSKFDKDGLFIEKTSNRCWEDDEDGLCLYNISEDMTLIGAINITHVIKDKMLIQFPKSIVGMVFKGRGDTSNTIGIGFRYSNGGASIDVFTDKGIVSMFSDCWENIGIIGATHELCVENIDTE